MICHLFLTFKKMMLFKVWELKLQAKVLEQLLISEKKQKKKLFQMRYFCIFKVKDKISVITVYLILFYQKISS